MFLEIYSKFSHVETSFLENNPRTRAETPTHPYLCALPFAIVVIPSSNAAPFSRHLFRRWVATEEGTADGPSSGTRLPRLCPPRLTHERPVLFPSRPSSALDPKPPHSATHPLTYPDPVARGPPPPHPRGAATPRARLTVIVLVHAPSVCRQPAYQSCRSAHVTKFLLLLLSLFTCLETWSMVCSFSFSLRVFDFRHHPTPPSLITFSRPGALVLEEIAVAAAYVRARAWNSPRPAIVRAHHTGRTDKVTERQKAITRERGREEHEYVKYELIACEPYPIAAGTYERRLHSGATLRTNHPVRGKSHASRNLVFAVIIVVAVVLFFVVACSRATQQRWSLTIGTSSDEYSSLHPVHGSLLTDRWTILFTGETSSSSRSPGAALLHLHGGHAAGVSIALK